jgi:small subunit ribosomal protein S16
MAVRIRLKRMGSKRKPFYRFVVVDSRGKRDGGFLEQVGYYNPISTPHEIKVDEAKIRDWLDKGAQMSDSARSLLKKAGVFGKAESPGGEAEATGAEVAAPAASAAVVAESKPAPPEPPKTEAKAEVTEPEATAPEPAETETAGAGPEAVDKEEEQEPEGK